MEPPSDPSDPAFVGALLENLVRGTRSSNALPSDDGYAATFPGYAASMASMGTRLSDMVQGLVDQQQEASLQAGHETGLDSVTSQFDVVVDLSGRMLERVDADLERAVAEQNAGILSGSEAIASLGTTAASEGTYQPSTPSLGKERASTSGVAKPQLRWRDEVRLYASLSKLPSVLY